MPDPQKSARWTTKWLVMVIFFLSANASMIFAAGQYYRVEQGDTFDTIAQRYRVSAYEIARANRIQINARLVPGTQIYIPVGTPSTIQTTTRVVRPSAPPSNASAPRQVRVQSGESLWKISKRYGLTIEQLASANGLSSKAGLEIGQILTIPTKEELAASRAPAQPDPIEYSSPSVVSKSSLPTKGVITGGSGATGRQLPSTMEQSKRGYSWPVQGVLLRRYENSSDQKHFGIDIAVPVGTEVHAARDGTVVYAGNITTYGKMVIISHADGNASCYAYNSLLLVSKDDKVRRGQVIARSGDPGKGDKPYFHFQLRKNGDAIDPLPYLP